MGKLAAIALSIALLLSGCSSMLSDSIKKIDYDSAGQFNGTWILQADDVVGNCRHDFSRTYVTIKSGIAKTTQGKGYVSHTGDFKIQDDVFHDSEKTTRIYNGNLIKGKGRMIVDYKSSYTTDCSMDFSVQKIK